MKWDAIGAKHEGDVMKFGHRSSGARRDENLSASRGRGRRLLAIVVVVLCAAFVVQPPALAAHDSKRTPTSTRWLRGSNNGYSLCGVSFIDHVGNPDADENDARSRADTTLHVGTNSCTGASAAGYLQAKTVPYWKNTSGDWVACNYPAYGFTTSGTVLSTVQYPEWCTYPLTQPETDVFCWKGANAFGGYITGTHYDPDSMFPLVSPQGCW